MDDRSSVGSETDRLRSEMGAELVQLRAELRNLRDDLDHHLLSCPGSLSEPAGWMTE